MNTRQALIVLLVISCVQISWSLRRVRPRKTSCTRKNQCIGPWCFPPFSRPNNCYQPPVLRPEVCPFCVRGRCPCACPKLSCPKDCRRQGGWARNERGCNTCQCRKRECPPVCAIFCPNGNVLDANGCPTCKCKPKECPPRCSLFCPNGKVLDGNGCPMCKCKPKKCPPVCAIFCKHGNVLDRNGCPTCQCKKKECPPVCKIFCPNGNVLDANGCPTCKCKPKKCPPKCSLFCPNGNVLDANGCPLCKCKKKECPPVCEIFCPNGNVLDKDGCPTCRCKGNFVEPPVLKPDVCPVCSRGYCPCTCPRLRCPKDCQEHGGWDRDEAGCNTCDCRPRNRCPPVCLRFCENGYVLDANGCPTCQCKKKPNCRPAPCAIALCTADSTCREVRGPDGCLQAKCERLTPVRD